MDALRSRYRDSIVGVLDAILANSGEALDRARDAVVAALKADRLVYVGGSGHSHMIAEEVFYRAGGIAAAQAILDPDLMLHNGAVRSTRLEREEGRAEHVLSAYPVGQGDVVFVASHSGRNAYPIELALAASARGATTVAITSLAHAGATTSRHRSGKLLLEVADIVIDNAGAYGDAALPIKGRTVRMGPTSTISGVFIVNAVMAEAVAALAADGVDVDVYQSANLQRGEVEEIVARWQPRIRGL
jgi:uncharacterized phosphosugar-binding protein